jgi:hypothetical protein
LEHNLASTSRRILSLIFKCPADAWFASTMAHMPNPSPLGSCWDGSLVPSLEHNQTHLGPGVLKVWLINHRITWAKHHHLGSGVQTYETNVLNALHAVGLLGRIAMNWSACPCLGTIIEFN